MNKSISEFDITALAAIRENVEEFMRYSALNFVNRGGDYLILHHKNTVVQSHFSATKLQLKRLILILKAELLTLPICAIVQNK